MKKLFKNLVGKRDFCIKSHGKSMLPLLHPDDIVCSKKTTSKRISVDDIILINKNKKIISHRVIYKTNKYLITKGDNNPTSDCKIYPRQIIGKVFQVKRTSDVLKRSGQIFNQESLYLLRSTLITFSTRLIDFS